MESYPNLVVEGEGGEADILSNPAVGFNSGADGEADATYTVASTAAAAAASTASSATIVAWRDSRPLIEQIISYPATSLLVVSFIVVSSGSLLSRTHSSWVSIPLLYYPQATRAAYRRLFYDIDDERHPTLITVGCFSRACYLFS